MSDSFENSAGSWPFNNLVPLRYGLILADPPWKFVTWGTENQTRAASQHYDVMELDAIKALPVGHLATGDCALVMWAMFSMLPQAIELMSAWGFTYKTGGAWAKQSKTGKKWSFGKGYVLRDACEPFLVGTVGNPEIGSHSIRNLIVSPVRQNSRKPDDMHKNLERLFPCVAKVELFARQSRPGWETWGNEATKFDNEKSDAVKSDE